MTAHLPLHRIAEGLARHGVQGRIHAGAQGRSARAFPAGYPRGCQGNVLHHTGSSGANPRNDIQYLINGRGDGFVIANAYAPPNGGIDLIASGPTYTEGKGGPRGLIPANGANAVVNSLEIANRGDGDHVYSPLQQRAVLAWATVCAELAAELWGWHDDPFGPDRLFSHAEWSPGRKVDPRGPSAWAPDGGIWNMDAFRADARDMASPTESAPPALPNLQEEDDDMKPFYWKHPNHPELFLVGSGGVIHVNAKLRDFVDWRNGGKLDRFESDDEAMYQRFMVMAGNRAA